MAQKNIISWYKRKYYPHFDSPLNKSDAQLFIEKFSKNPSYAFYPLLAYDQKFRHFKGRKQIEMKKRPIKYAAHKDGYIYSFYAEKLSKDYEKRISDLGVEQSIIAYRSGKGNNIDFAKAAFDEIQRRKFCVAIAMDISGFFDNIDHQNLKKEWCCSLNLTHLPNDHFAVYRSLTKWAEVKRDACFDRLKKHMPIFNKRKPPKPLCTAEDFRNIVKGRALKIESLVESNLNSYGIPQGTAISALLSNIYMTPFDLSMVTLANEIGGYYRRYSDDILWVADAKYQDRILQQVDRDLKKRGDRLLRKEEKTDISIFNAKVGGSLSCNKPFQYLGFTYDGKKILIRSKTLSKYWRRLIYSVKRTKRKAVAAGKIGKNNKPFRKKLYLMHTHLGQRNFVKGYAYKAQKKIGEPAAIRQQLSRHMERINKELNKS